MSIIKVSYTPKYLETTGILLLPQSFDNFTDFNNEEKISTLIHEITHHINSISSNYLYLQSLLSTTYSLEIVYGKRNSNLHKLSKYLVSRNNANADRSFGVSITDLLEGNAVLCSYQYGYKNGTVGEFLNFRDRYFPGKGNSVYRRTFDIVSHFCGEENAFDLLSVLTFLSLQGDIPGRSFEALLRHPKVRSKELIGLSLEQIVKELEYDERIITKYKHLDLTPKNHRHMVFYNLLHELFKLASYSEIIEIFGRPWKINNLSCDNVIQCVYPPIIIGSYSLKEKASISTYGLAFKDLDFRDTIITLQSIIGAAQGILSIANTSICPHSECDSFASNMCSGWYLFNEDSDTCGFRNRTLSMANMKPHEIFERKRNLISYEQFLEYRENNDLNVLFPRHEEINIRREKTFAEKFDNHFLLDEIDNDSELLVFCKQCGITWNAKVSFRAIRMGVKLECPKCGYPKHLDDDETAFINIEN